LPSCTPSWAAYARGLSFHLADYLDLVNWTGRAVRDDKHGAIAEDLPPILERIGITRAAWPQLAKDFETHCCTLDQSTQAWRAGLPASWRALGTPHPLVPAAVSQLSALGSLPETP